MLSKSIMGGVCIGIGSLIYIKMPNSIGAIFFSVGLLLIMTLNYKLYTGIIGYADTKSDFKNAGIILLGNCIGTFIALLGAKENAQNIVNIKLTSTWLSIFLRACLCGGIIYGCVEAHKAKENLLIILFVAAFILSGAEHSIADLCYFIAARTFSLQSVIFFIIVVIGNMLGAQIFRRISV